jgi:hypothetical protein
MSAIKHTDPIWPVQQFLDVTFFEDANDFFALFEADTFDEEEDNGDVYVAYVDNKLAAKFVRDENGGGTGWYNDRLV